MSTKPDTETPDKQPAAETLEWIAESIARRGLPFSAFINSVEYKNALNFITKEVLSALRNERENQARKADKKAESLRRAIQLTKSPGDCELRIAETAILVADDIARSIRKG